MPCFKRLLAMHAQPGQQQHILVEFTREELIKFYEKVRQAPM
jgi:hypothetical protein